MPRKSNGRRRGPPTWAKGTQLIFLTTRMSYWFDQTAVQRGQFYSDVTWLFLKKYGWDLADNEDLDPNEEEIDNIRQELSDGGETIEEQERRRKIFSKLRDVSNIFCPPHTYILTS